MLARITVLLGLVAAATAQSTSTTRSSSAAPPVSTAAIPTCALTCVVTALPGSSCASYGITNLTCICTSTSFQLAYYQCQQSTCTTTDLNAAQAYGAQSCQANGTPINITAVPSGYTSGAPVSSTSIRTSVSASDVLTSSAPASSSSAAATTAPPAATTSRAAARTEKVAAAGLVGALFMGAGVLLF